MKILVIDNRGQYTHLIWRTLRDLGVETKIVPNSTPLEQLDCDSLVLSGGPFSVHTDLDDKTKMGFCREYLALFDGAVLGICLGHQAMAQAFGGRVDRGERGEYGYSEIVVDKPIGVLEKVGNFKAWVSHFDEVKQVPKGFDVLAHSDICETEAMGSLEKARWGVQFHPEVSHTEKGEQILQNFIDLCKK